MGIYEAFSTDSEVERTGVWLNYGGARFKVARAGGANKKFIRRQESFVRKFRKQIEMEILGEDEATLELINIWADTVFLNWEGITDRDGKLLSFNRENVVKVMRDLPDLFKTIRDDSMRMVIFKSTIDEDAAENLPQSSATA